MKTGRPSVGPLVVGLLVGLLYIVQALIQWQQGLEAIKAGKLEAAASYNVAAAIFSLLWLLATFFIPPLILAYQWLVRRMSEG